MTSRRVATRQILDILIIRHEHMPLRPHVAVRPLYGEAEVLGNWMVSRLFSLLTQSLTRLCGAKASIARMIGALFFAGTNLDLLSS